MKNRLAGMRKHAWTILVCFILVSVIITSYQLYENKTSNFATPEALMPSYLHDMNIRIADLTNEEMYIRNKTFDHCDLWGPAMIVFSDSTIATNVGIIIVKPEDKDAIFVETTNRSVAGAVVFDNCVIRDCKLHRIGFIGDHDRITTLKAVTHFQ